MVTCPRCEGYIIKDNTKPVTRYKCIMCGRSFNLPAENPLYREVEARLKAELENQACLTSA